MSDLSLPGGAVGGGGEPLPSSGSTTNPANPAAESGTFTPKSNPNPNLNPDLASNSSPNPPILSQATTTTSSSPPSSSSSNLLLPTAFISDLSSGPIRSFLVANTSKDDITPRQVRDSLMNNPQVESLESKHFLKVNFQDKIQKKQISSAIKEVWESLGEYEEEVQEKKKAEKRDMELAMKLHMETNGSRSRKASSTASGSGSGSRKRKKIDSDMDDLDREEEEMNDERPASGKTKKKAKVKKPPKLGPDGKKLPPNPNNPFNRPLMLDAQMAEICGGHSVSPTLGLRGKEGSKGSWRGWNGLSGKCPTERVFNLPLELGTFFNSI